MQTYPNSVGYVKRFSLCNCLTLHYPETYTAHGMTIDYFINVIEAGKEIQVPHADLWPNGYIHKYKIPKKIDTFLFSTFNEVYHQNYKSNDDDQRYAIGPHNECPELDKYYTPIDRLTETAFSLRLKEMDEKVRELFGNTTKIILFYDHTRAPEDVKKRFIAYNNACVLSLRWPFYYVKDTVRKDANWFHYENKCKTPVLNSIINEEAKHETR